MPSLFFLIHVASTQYALNVYEHMQRDSKTLLVLYNTRLI